MKPQEDSFKLIGDDEDPKVNVINSHNQSRRNQEYPRQVQIQVEVKSLIENLNGDRSVVNVDMINQMKNAQLSVQCAKVQQCVLIGLLHVLME